MRKFLENFAGVIMLVAVVSIVLGTVLVAFTKAVIWWKLAYG